MSKYETIEHTADTGVRAFGDTVEEAFCNAAAGMFSIISDPAGVQGKERFDISVEAEDRETLLVEWLNELLYLYDSRGMLMSRFQIDDMSETSLRGAAWGESIKPSRHDLRTDIKAVTYHMLKVERRPEGWVAEVIFDV